MRTQKSAGFTLIELSIVLVIIGLIVGGVLVGRDLINAAKLRATISQIEKLKTAATTFKIKFNALPGDIQASQAAAFGFAARTGGTGDGDGDGFIEGCGQTPGNGPLLGCETVFFWTDLAKAGLISGTFTTNTDAAIAGLASSAQFAPYLPPTPFGGRSYLFVYGSADGAGTMPGPQNYIELLVVDDTIAGGQLQNNIGANALPLSPYTAWSIDNKVDDGLPCTGHVIGTRISLPAPTGGFCLQTLTIPGYQPDSFDCWGAATNPYTYALTSTNPPSNYPYLTCGLQFDAQF
jgi:prepilin-type N-terminal cleavage/methylation domain-containing protein